MNHPERIEDYLDHLAEALRHAIDYADELEDSGALERDFKTRDAIVHNLMIIGEASGTRSSTIISTFRGRLSGI